jgi:hypothetical protein
MNFNVLEDELIRNVFFVAKDKSIRKIEVMKNSSQFERS